MNEHKTGLLMNALRTVLRVVEGVAVGWLVVLLPFAWILKDGLGPGATDSHGISAVVRTARILFRFGWPAGLAFLAAHVGLRLTRGKATARECREPAGRVRAWMLATIAFLLGVGVLFAWSFLSRRDTGIDTSVEKREVRFYKDGGNWYADVPQHTQAQNQMVAGADLLLDYVACGGNGVSVVLSADIPSPGEWLMHLHIVEHDRFGATYSVRDAGQEPTRLIWLCNVMHTVFGGEHPEDIYIHSISRVSGTGDTPQNQAPKPGTVP